MTTPDRFAGCLIGLAFGDAACAAWEGGVLERLAWRLIGRTRDGRLRWTDDTAMALDLADHCLRGPGIRQDELARAFAASYRWSRGYGRSTAQVLAHIRRGMPWRQAAVAVHADGSFGNGAAMRVPVLALLHHRSPADLDQAVERSAEVTHAHAEARQGARLIARAVVHGLHDAPVDAAMADLLASAPDAPWAPRLRAVAAALAGGTRLDARGVRAGFPVGVRAIESCPTALLLAFSHRDRPIGELLALVRACGGDTDTIGAMAGAIWGAYRGLQAMPREEWVRIEDWERILEMAQALHARAGA